MKKIQDICTHSFILLFLAGLLLPLYLAFVAASHTGEAMMHAPLPLLPGSKFFTNLQEVFFNGVRIAGGMPVWCLLLNSFIMAILIAFGKIALALMSAFALIYFQMPLKKLQFAFIFFTMMLPIEVRVVPTFQVVAQFGLLNHWAGLTVPLMASATGVFLFRQFFKTIPPQLVEAAILDGITPWRFFFDMLIPLAKTPIISLFIILFIYGWNQYLWPLVVMTEPKHATVVMGIRYLAGVADEIPQWNYIMAVALLALLPPCILVISLQRWFEKGLMH